MTAPGLDQHPVGGVPTLACASCGCHHRGPHMFPGQPIEMAGGFFIGLDTCVRCWAKLDPFFGWRDYDPDQDLLAYGLQWSPQGLLR